MNRLAILAVVLALAGCSGASDHPGHGTVVSVDAAKGEITLDHEDIPGLMRAMTMTYHAEPALLSVIRAGQAVDFRVRETDGSFELTAIEPR